MSQPTQADQGTLKFAADGGPTFGYYVGTPNTTGTLKFVANGGPLYAPGSAITPTARRPIITVLGFL